MAKARVKLARMMVAITDRKEPCGHHSASYREMTTDLPADALGECLAEAIQKSWKAGVDPTDMLISVHFI